MSINLRLLEAETVYLELGRIKKFKQEVAARELAKKQNIFNDLIKQLAASSAELRSFRVQMRHEENAKFKQILSQKVSMSKLTDLRQTLREMARNEQKMVLKLDELQQKKLEANDALVTARDKYHAARKKVLKFDAVEDLITVEKLKFVEQTEEKLLEEFQIKKEETDGR